MHSRCDSEYKVVSLGHRYLSRDGNVAKEYGNVVVIAPTNSTADEDCTAVPNAPVIMSSCLINKKLLVLDIDLLDMEVVNIAD